MGRYALQSHVMSVPDCGLFVVVPTIRPELLDRFCEEWLDPDLNVNFIFMHDSPELPDEITVESPLVTHLCWGDIDDDLGDRRWIIPRRSDCVRSYGFLRAKQMGARYILSLDDDCLPGNMSLETFFSKHLAPLVHGVKPYLSTTGSHNEKRRPRGLPDDFQDAIIGHPLQVGINHGLWDGILDRAGRDELLYRASFPDVQEILADGTEVVPAGFFYPMCGMNVCFDVAMLPAMYFTLQGHWFDRETNILTKLPYDRWGDIWCGAISKFVADKSGRLVTTGDPHVWHDRMSNAESNVIKEEAGLDLHPYILRTILELSAGTFGGKVPSMVDTLSFQLRGVSEIGANEQQSEYMNTLCDAIDEWVKLTSDLRMS